MKTILRAYKFRLYPNKQQIEYFEKCFGCCRFIYNKMLDDRIKYYQETGKSLKTNPASYKKDYEFLKEVDSLALCSEWNNLNSAYKNFFERKESGFPKFKSKHCSHQSYTTFNQKGTIAITNNGMCVKLPKIGKVCFVYHRQLPENSIIRSATISKTATNKYFISILVAEEYQELESTGCIVGIDLGIKDLVITSNGDKFDNSKTTSKYSKKLAKQQRRLSKMKKGSSNYKKQKVKVALVYEKIANTRKDTLHKISRFLISENQVIVSENLKVSNMVKNHKLAKAIEDCSWSMLTSMIEYKSSWNDRDYLKIDTFYPSSKTCSSCGYKLQELSLDTREWTCPSCGQHHDRDINAAINIMNEGLRILNF